MKQPVFETDSPFYDMAGYSLANLHIGVKGGSWQTAAFVENLLDKRAEVDLYNAYGSNIPTTQPLGLNRPRTIGIEFRMDR
jgi:outer membrane receptor protein involved in Fe transport